ncbi:MULTISPECIES: PH domain-containing protein [unclassified Deinococcus]|uniref:PH domain-containing protein n=1 Tax=unclassified Deinococcus TaxID=2623546 RepID=UPI001C2FBF62|nr:MULTISPECIES: PH domain-containing protein [unclassified Deinococcus]MDK2013104.1 PH domain-containing protein [Deinococcus sp. 43]
MTAPLSAAPPTSPVWFRALVWLVPLLLIVTAWIPDDGADKPLPVAGSVALTLLGVGLGALFAQVPRRLAYTLTDTGLRVSRFSGTFEWPYRELRVRRTDAGLGLRVGGVGLPGYYTGNYTFTGAGYRSMQAIASNTRGGLIVERGGTPYYLTPADPDAFAQALAARGVPMLD